MSPVIGVLALQGAFAKHIERLHELGVETIEVRTRIDLERCDALIIPGGESTTMMKQMEFIQLKDPLRKFSQQKPVFGTCAGLILMSKEVLADTMKSFDLLDISVERNAFGRQVESFHAEIEVDLEKKKTHSLLAVFIRAPRIKRVGADVKVLAEFEGEPILVQQGRHLGATFHPELTEDTSIHEYFLKKVREEG